jgi:hypothetical protein
VGWRISALFLKAVSAASVAFAVFTFMTPQGSSSWPTTEAHILSSRFVGVVSPSPPGRSRSRGSAVFRRYHIDYEYTLDGVHYTGSGSGPEAPGNGLLSVYVDPRDPSSSVIEPGLDGFLVFGSLALAAVSYAFARMLRAAGGP